MTDNSDLSDGATEIDTVLDGERDNYDFSQKSLDNVPTYYQQGKEMTKVLTDIDQRQETGKLPRYIIGGPTGCGKSLFAKAVANNLDVPYFEIQCKYSMNELDLLGSPRMVGGSSYWSDGPLTKALLASQEGPVVLLLDEVNRARPESKGVLLPALDSRAQVVLEPRGGEVIDGIAENLIVFATINEGPGYMTEKMDKAEMRRFNTRFNLTYLGETRPDAEIKLLTERTPVPSAVALEMVGVANTVRSMAADENTKIRHGIPTAMLLSWARTSVSYAEKGINDPVIEAAQETIVNPFYSDNDESATEVDNIIDNELGGAPMEESDELYEWFTQETNPRSRYSSIEDVPSHMGEETLVQNGLPQNIADSLTQDGGIYKETLLDAGLSERTVMLLARDS